MERGRGKEGGVCVKSLLDELQHDTRALRLLKLPLTTHTAPNASTYGDVLR